MKEDPNLKKKLEAAAERQNTYVARQAEAGDRQKRKASDASGPGEVPAAAEAAAAEAEAPEEAEEGRVESAAADSDEDLPEAGEEPEAKRPRMRSSSTVQEEDFDEQPEQKRPRVGLLEKKSWADLEDDEYGGVNEEVLVCAHCGVRFGSSKQMAKHLKISGGNAGREEGAILCRKFEAQNVHERAAV